MKVFHVTDRIPGLHKDCGGAEQACLRAVRLLNGAGWADIRIGAMRAETNASPDFGYTELRSLESYAGKGLAGRMISAFKNRAIPFDPVSFISSYREFKRSRPDIVHLHKAALLSFSVIHSAMLLGIPAVFSVYDYTAFCPGGFLSDSSGNLCRKFHGLRCMACDVFRKNVMLSRLSLSARWKAVFDFYFRNIRAFVVLSKASAGILESYGIDGKKIHIIPQAASDAGDGGGSEPEGDSVFFAGWMDRKKGLDVIVRAMPSVVKEVPGAMLHVFEMPADGGYRREIEDYIDANGLGGSVRFHGRAAPDEFKRVLAGSSCVAVPEQWENMSPVIIAEAMMHGKPVVASRIGGIPEFVRDDENGFLVKRDDPEAFASKIVRLLKDKEKARRMGERSRRMALEIFDKDVIAGLYLRLYECLVEENAGRTLYGRAQSMKGAL